MIASWTVTLTLEGPILTKATAPGAYGLDAIMARNTAGCPCLPGSLIKGRLRQAWEELGIDTGRLGPDPVTGKDGATSSNEPHRGATHFGDFLLVTPPPAKIAEDSDAQKDDRDASAGFRHRVAIEATTGAAKERALMMVETPFGSGAEVSFQGIIEAALPDADEDGVKLKLRRDLLLGLWWNSHLGSQRGVGFGRVLKVEIQPLPSPEPDSAPAASPSTGSPQHTAGASRPLVEFDKHGQARIITIAITPQGPFCLSRHRTKENLYESTDIIPGAAIKGCLAEYWRQTGKSIPPWFDLLRVSHAFPAPEGKWCRPVARPLSLVMNDAKEWFDSTLCQSAFLFPNADAPKYLGGWKSGPEKDEVATHFGWASPRRSLRVRTAIDRHTQSAKDEFLFAHELVEPGGCVWLARVDASALTPEERGDLARDLNHGLRGLGKTKARASIHRVPQDETAGGGDAIRQASSDKSGSTLVLTLQTPAVLLDPRGLHLPENRTAAALLAHYRRIFHELLGEEAVTLQHFYASQSLAGGDYLWRRFQGGSEEPGKPGRPYNPWLLTEPGSVFVFETPDADTAARLAAYWHGRGLRLPQWTKDKEAYGLTLKPAEDWKRCPFLPENGYGEVATNLSCHWEKRPQGITLLGPLVPDDAPPGLETPAASAAATAGPPPPALVPKTAPQPDQAPETTSGQTPAPSEDVSSASGKKPANYQSAAISARWRITGTLTTDTLLHIGSGDTTRRKEITNEQTGKEVEINAVLRDFKNHPLIPGASLRGVLRAALQQRIDGTRDSAEKARLMAASGRLFGHEAVRLTDGTKTFQAGQLTVHDSRQTGDAAPPEGAKHLPYWDKDLRTAVIASAPITRRTRTAADGKLHHREAVPPKAVFHVDLQLDVRPPASQADARGVPGRHDIQLLLALLTDGLHLGAETANGWGKVKWQPKEIRRITPEDLTGWPDTGDDCQSPVQGHLIPLSDLPPPDPSPALSRPTRTITLQFSGAFLTKDADKSSTRRIEKAARKKAEAEGASSIDSTIAETRRDPQGDILLPASSVRGVLRSHAERILRTLNGSVADPTLNPPIAVWQEDKNGGEGNGGSLELSDLISRMFGATGWKSPIQISDFIGTGAPYLQEMVAIDRFTGAGAESRKFTARPVWQPVLTGTLTIDEAKWAVRGCECQDWAPGLLSLLLRDLEEGDLRFGMGSAKGYGHCTAIVDPPMDPQTSAASLQRLLALLTPTAAGIAAADS